MAVPQPTGPELEILTVIWGQPEENLPLKLGQIYDLVKERRERFGEPAPAITTVSSTLRSAVARGLLTELRLTGGEAVPVSPVRVRGTLHPTRSPQTAYKHAADPAVALRPMLKILADAFPEKDRAQGLIEFARALQLPEKTVKELRKVLGVS
ncbi:MAG: hypothetical protein L0Y72_22385 [Gemmataceae bacterium]|nr:hypothetical protein [Gemmataceae bacterium]MCI0741791.1 hypothetical protein [Gemmataceae bacterium]